MLLTYKDLDPITVQLFQRRIGEKDGNGCMLWLGGTGGKNGYRYGIFKTKIGDTKYVGAAHRISWMLANGRDVPKDLSICHTCDVPLCTNPAHLFLGTHTDNMKDRSEKGRQPKGATHGQAVLSTADVLEIRRLCKLDYSDTELARIFGVSNVNIKHIITHKTWKHIP